MSRTISSIVSGLLLNAPAPIPSSIRHYIRQRGRIHAWGRHATGFLQSRSSRIFLDKEFLFDFTDRTTKVAQSGQIARILPVSEWKNPRNLDRLRYLASRFSFNSGFDKRLCKSPSSSSDSVSTLR